jgi:hypothetical protein
MVTRNHVESATGRPVAKGVQGGAGASCDYAGTDGRVTITARRLPAGFDFDREIGSLRAAVSAANVRFAPGLGIRAVFVDLPGAGTQLHVITRSNVYVLVSVLGFGDAGEVSAAAETLARRVLNMV